MKLVYFQMKILCYLLIVPCVISGRKYDLETEAMKLYGEDFHSVLKRFRRTPDYLKILRDKITDLNTLRSDIGLHSLHFFYGNIVQNVREMLGQNNTEDNMNTLKPFNAFRSPSNFRREGSSEEKKSPIQELDSYYKLNSTFCVAERNALRDLGFQYAGNVIHAVIKGMGPEDASAKSTQIPFAGDNVKFTTTTEHVLIHQVTSEPVPESTAAPEVPTTVQAFRYKYRPSHTKSK